MSQEYPLTPQELAFGGVIEQVLGGDYTDKVISADQRQPGIPTPYASFKIITDTSIAAQTTQKFTLDETQLIEETRRLLISVHAFGPNAYADLRLAKLKIEAPVYVQQLLDEAEMSIVDSSTIRRLSSAEVGSRDEHAQLDFILQYVLSTSVNRPCAKGAEGNFEEI